MESMDDFDLSQYDPTELILKDEKFILNIDVVFNVSFFPYKNSERSKLPPIIEAFIEVAEANKTSSKLIPIKLPKNDKNRSLQDKKITAYISEAIFNAHWSTIKTAMYTQRRVNSLLYEPIKDTCNFDKQVDLSLCESSTRSAYLKNNRICFTSKKPNEHELKLISNRSRLMDNTKIIYIYSKRGGPVHDKSCSLVKAISNEDFCGSELLPEGRSLCDSCKMSMFIRKACHNDSKNLNWYIGFFKRGNISFKSLKKMITEYGSTFKMVDKDTLYLHCNEDSWQIRYKSNGNYTLLHNNYRITGQMERYIGMPLTYHIQQDDISLGAALYIIRSYDFYSHFTGSDETDINQAAITQIPKNYAHISVEPASVAPEYKVKFNSFESKNDDISHEKANKPSKYNKVMSESILNKIVDLIKNILNHSSK